MRPLKSHYVGGGQVCFICGKEYILYWKLAQREYVITNTSVWNGRIQAILKRAGPQMDIFFYEKQ